MKSIFERAARQGRIRIVVGVSGIRLNEEQAARWVTEWIDSHGEWGYPDLSQRQQVGVKLSLADSLATTPEVRLVSPERLEIRFEIWSGVHVWRDWLVLAVKHASEACGSITLDYVRPA